MVTAITTGTRITGTAMTDAAALYRLFAWLSPGYPVGAFSYSHGLEQAIEAGYATDADSCCEWLRDIVGQGAGFSDTVFLMEAHRATKVCDRTRLAQIAELAAAFTATREIALESHAQGAAFLEITGKAWDCSALAMLRACWEGPYAYPVAVGCAAAGHEIALEPTATAYLHAFAANLVSAAVRLVPLGQTDGQRITAALEPLVAETIARALIEDVEHVCTATLMTDICSMKHETQHTRLFRS